MEKELEKFVRDQVGSNRPRSQWFHSDELNLYLRAGAYHNENGRFRTALGISNVSVTAKRFEGKGHFKSLILFIEEMAKRYGYFVVRVEEVVSPHLLEMLLRNGYEQYKPNMYLIPIVYKIIKGE